MSNPWGGGGIGAWAAEAEREEEEQQAAAAASAAVDSQSFPSLREAATAKQKKKKKMTLSEFYSASGPQDVDHRGLTPDEMLQLPTGPRQRLAEEMQHGRLGGGFSFRNRSGPPVMSNRGDTDGSWGGGGGWRSSYGGGFDDDRRGPPRRVSDFEQTSRADDVDDWSKAKKFLPSFDQGSQNRFLGIGGGGTGGSRGGRFVGFSGADEADNWSDMKKPLPTRSSTFGSGFRSSGPEPDQWTRGAVPAGGGGERPRLVLDPPKRNSGGDESPPPPVVNTNKPNPFGAAKPREEVLADKGLDWKKLDLEIDAKKVNTQTSRPSSEQSSRPSSAQSGRSNGLENVVKPRAKVNPFGDAKPREVLLEERGQDWRRIDMELEQRRVERPETNEERLLKEEIEHLKEELEKESGKPNKDNQPSLNDMIRQKEKELETLIHDLDDKVRFKPKTAERPGSGAGRVSSFAEKSHSRSGSIDESMSVESIDRPRSRGMADVWSRPSDDNRRSVGGSRQQGFLHNRDMDRPKSRERW